jgi:hypothetical protein
LILRLSRLAALYVLLLGSLNQLGTRHGACSAPSPAHAAPSKIEFSYLNRNLMVPDIHPLTLALDRNSRKGGQRRFLCEQQ